MPHVQRGPQGSIVAIFGEVRQGITEWVPFNDPEVVSFLGCQGQPCPMIPDLNELSQIDMSLIRIIEDLIDLMTQKNMIMFTELPTAAQAKLLSKRSVRERLQESSIDLDEGNVPL